MAVLPGRRTQGMVVPLNSRGRRDRRTRVDDRPSSTCLSRSEAQHFLESVLPELAKRAERFGATAEPECSVSAALAKMDRVTQMIKVRDYQVTIVVAAPKKRPFGVAKWWQAVEGVGLVHGDGDLFWLYNEDFTEETSESYELFCAEPYSVPGYFHEGDLQVSVAFPDVALHFRARDVKAPIPLLHRMAGIAQQLAQSLGATLLTNNGRSFRLDSAEAEAPHNQRLKRKAS